MLWSFCVLLSCQAVGELLHAVTGLPIPGTVFGLGLLLAGMCLFGYRAGPSLLPAADALLPYLGLFFVPPGVAAVLRLSHLTSALPGIAAALLVSSLLTFVATGHVAQWLLARQTRRLSRRTPDIQPSKVQVP